MNIDLSGLIERYKNKAVDFVVIAVALFIAFNIYKGQNNDLAKVNGKKEMAVKKNEVLESISRSEKKISSYKRVFPQKDSSEVINALGQIARHSGVQIASVKPSPEDKSTYYDKYPFSLTINASSYYELGRFIRDMENNQNFYVVEDLDVRSDSRSKEYPVAATLKVSTIKVKE